MAMESRFAFLLQPIRDLTKNWDVDVASQLEEYLTEVAKVTISFDSGTTKMNFAEAALLIQGSACVYSKKVEYLYALVYQTLDLMASKRKQQAQLTSVDEQGRDADASFAHRKSEDEFLTLDDIQEGKNIDLVEGNKDCKSESVIPIPRTPISLMPVQESERSASTPILSAKGEMLGNKSDFKMNMCSLSSSGALLLEPIKHSLVQLAGRELLATPTARDTCTTPPAAVCATREVPDAMDASAASPRPRDECQDAVGLSDDEDHVVAMQPSLSADSCHNSPKINEAAPDRSVKHSRRVQVEQEAVKALDPWKLIDPHQPCAKTENKPMKKGSSVKLASSLMKKPPSRKRKQRDDVTSAASVACQVDENLTEFLLKSFYSCSSMFPKDCLRAPISTEFESLYWAELKARKQQRQKEKQKLSSLQRGSPTALEQLVKEEEAEENVESYQPLGLEESFDEYQMQEAAGEGAPVGDEGRRLSFAGVEPMALDDSSTKGLPVVQNYEDLVRNYVESNVSSGLAYVRENEFSSLLREWEDKINPILSAQEARSAFDIHQYAAEILREFETLPSGETLLFSQVVTGKEVHEVCRYFTAVLQLVNSMNLAVEPCDRPVDSFRMRLLSSTMMIEAMSSYRAPSLFCEELHV